MQSSASSEQNNLWSRIKQSSKGFSASFSHDHDGDSETDTLIHKALVHFYDSRDEDYPNWLGASKSRRMPRPSGTQSFLNEQSGQVPQSRHSASPPAFAQRTASKHSLSRIYQSSRPGKDGLESDTRSRLGSLSVDNVGSPSTPSTKVLEKLKRKGSQVYSSDEIPNTGSTAIPPMEGERPRATWRRA